MKIPLGKTSARFYRTSASEKVRKLGVRKLTISWQYDKCFYSDDKLEQDCAKSWQILLYFATFAIERLRKDVSTQTLFTAIYKIILLKDTVFSPEDPHQNDISSVTGDSCQILWKLIDTSVSLSNIWWTNYMINPSDSNPTSFLAKIFTIRLNRFPPWRKASKWKTRLVRNALERDFIYIYWVSYL